MRSKTAFIVNPRAGNGSTESDWPFIKSLAKDRLGSFDTYITSSPGDATAFAKSVTKKGVDLLICVGGDGTLNEVINGVLANDISVKSKPTLGFIPDGTGCDFIKTVSIPEDIEKSIQLITQGNLCPLDVGRLFFKDNFGCNTMRYFHNIASFGLGGEVDRRVNRTTKAFGPFLSFIWATLVSIILYGKKHIHIKTDKGKEYTYKAWNIAAANGKYHGGGMLVAPDAVIDDGLFHITVIGDLSLSQVFVNLPKLYNGKIKDIDKVVTFTAERIEAWSDRQVLLDVDGEQPGMLPVVMEIVPQALNIIANEKAPL